MALPLVEHRLDRESKNECLENDAVIPSDELLDVYDRDAPVGLT